MSNTLTHKSGLELKKLPGIRSRMASIHENLILLT